MDRELKSLLGPTLDAVLNTLQRFPISDNQPYLAFERTGPGSWNLHLKRHPDFPEFFTREDLKNAGTSIEPLFQKHYPEHTGLVGTATMTASPMSARELLFRIISEIWKRHETWSPPQAALDELLKEVQAFLDEPNVRLTYIAPLINFDTDEASDLIKLPLGLQIRRLTDREYTDLNGGSIYQMTGRSMNTRPRHEFAFVGEFTETKLLGSSPTRPDQTEFETLRRNLDRAILALRTFHSEPIGYEGILVKSKSFAFPGGEHAYSWGEYVPFGVYRLPGQDYDRFRHHLKRVSARLHPSILLACRRLASATTRTSPQDRILDLVIGMEAILLVTLDKKLEYRGENRYRFSLNYASLFPHGPDRLERFKEARKLYDLRSNIAHGGSPPEAELASRADSACEMLRRIIEMFLDDGVNPPYTKSTYWDGAYFGLPSGEGGED